MENLISYSHNRYKDTEWGFKGHKNLNEEIINCVNREFKEETNININDYELIEDYIFEELYMSTNKVKYKHKYFIAQIKNIDISIDKNNRKQLIEISDIKWMNYEETVSNIRNYSIEK